MAHPIMSQKSGQGRSSTARTTTPRYISTEVQLPPSTLHSKTTKHRQQTNIPCNASFPKASPPLLTAEHRWGFNAQTHAWTQYDVSLAAPQRPSWGAFAEATEQGMAFYLNGMISNLSSAATASANTPPTNLEGMIALDLHKHTVRSLCNDICRTTLISINQGYEHLNK